MTVTASSKWKGLADMQILIMGGEDVKKFPANSKESPLRALCEAVMDSPESNPVLVTEITTREGTDRLRSVYSDDATRKVINEILDERYGDGDKRKETVGDRGPEEV